MKFQIRGKNTSRVLDALITSLEVAGDPIHVDQVYNRKTGVMNYYVHGRVLVTMGQIVTYLLNIINNHSHFFDVDTLVAAKYAGGYEIFKVLEDDEVPVNWTPVTIPPLQYEDCTQ